MWEAVVKTVRKAQENAQSRTQNMMAMVTLEHTPKQAEQKIAVNADNLKLADDML
jgi:hypothetical protein